MVTGTEPSTHGVYDFHDYDDEYGSEYVSAENVDAPFLWEYLSAHGLASIVVNVPVTHPAHEFDGSLVPGYLASEDAVCLIDGEARPMDEFDEEYRIYADGEGSRDRQLDEYERLIRSRARAAERLSATHDWSFMMVQIQRTDSVFHKFGDDEDAVRRVYAAVDDAIGSVLETAGDCDVLVASDHGMHQYDWIFHCNTWLRENGYLRTTAESERQTWNDRAKASLARKADDAERSDGSVASDALRVALNALSCAGVTPRRAERALSFVGLSETVRGALPSDVLADAAEHVDWRRSEAYCRSITCPGIRLNVEGREREGVVPSDEFDRARAALIEELREVRAPDGNPAFDEVWDRHERTGSDVSNEPSAPDIFLRPRAMKVEVSDIVREPVFQATDQYNHRYEGLLIASGPNVRSTADVSPRVVDVAPTVLRLLGVEPPATLDGTALTAMISTGDPELPPPEPKPRTYVSDADAGASDAGEDRLKDMGYLD